MLIGSGVIWDSGIPKNWWQPILVLVGIYIAYKLFGSYLVPEIMKIGDRPDISHLMNIPGNLQGLIISLILEWITAAFLEELIFRGFLLNAIDRLLGGTKWSMWTSVVISSLSLGSFTPIRDLPVFCSPAALDLFLESLLS